MEYRPNTTVKNIRKRKRRAAPIFGLWLFLLFCCFLAAYFFLNSAYFSVVHFEVSGSFLLPAEEVLNLSGLNPGANIFKLDTREAVTKIETHPYIKKAAITRKLPQTLLINVEERFARAFVLGKGEFLIVDPEGIILEKTTELKERTYPIISGVSLKEGPLPGENILTPGLKAALALVDILDEKFLSNVSEIVAATPESMILKTKQGVQIRFGPPEDLERKISLIRELLFDHGTIINDQTVEYIDLRYDTAPVIKRKK
ncbi:MAG: FtsQ-type POTRA domain-containing protein [Clostridia bacterium]|nr:FtsQ-type POTRA domain-containing protein [Clostridia bacterium]